MASLNINQGVIAKAIKVGGKTTFVVILANQTGFVYITDTLTRQALHDPDGFITQSGITPRFILSWAIPSNAGKGGCILEPCDPTGKPKDSLSENDLELLDKVLPVVNRKVKTVFDMFTFFSREGILLVARNYLTQMFDVMTADEVTNYASILVGQWINQGRKQLGKILTDEPDSETTAYIAAIQTTTLPTARKRKVKDLNSVA